MFKLSISYQSASVVKLSCNKDNFFQSHTHTNTHTHTHTHTHMNKQTHTHLCSISPVKHLVNCKTQPPCTSYALFKAFSDSKKFVIILSIVTLQMVSTGGQHPSGAVAQPEAPNQPETNQATSGRDKQCHAVLTTPGMAVITRSISRKLRLFKADTLKLFEVLQTRKLGTFIQAKSSGIFYKAIHSAQCVQDALRQLGIATLNYRQSLLMPMPADTISEDLMWENHPFKQAAEDWESPTNSCQPIA